MPFAACKILRIKKGMKVMIKTFYDFKAKKDFLVCIDSDGCAMDTMELKHRHAFGPLAIKVWGLEDIQESFLERWFAINLYQKSRGINRFKGMAKIFEDMSLDGFKMPDYAALKKWTQTSPELSARSLGAAYAKSKDPSLLLTLEWSKEVNQTIESLRGQDKPFSYVKESLQALHQFADIAIVSSANTQAVQDEWTRHSLIDYVDILCGQELGSKAYCIQELRSRGNYSDNHTLMIGDALGDYDAALQNHTLYYPILARKENASWQAFFTEAIKHFKEENYQGSYSEQLIQEFIASFETNK